MNAEFDGVNLLIKINQGVTVIDIQTDIYSAWKAWLQTGSNAKFLPALRTIGGDPTVGEKMVAPYFFLMNGWKIKPYSWNHTLNLVGNLFVDDPEIYGANVVVPPDGNYTVLVNMSTTSDASKLLVGSGVTSQDKMDISKGVWDECRAVAVKGKVDLLPPDPASESGALAKERTSATKTQIAELTTRLNEIAQSNSESFNIIIKECYRAITEMVDELEPMLIRSSPKDLAEYLNREKMSLAEYRKREKGRG